jgi:uncharacterized membrane protein YraQ (UPF0718 family)
MMENSVTANASMSFKWPSKQGWARVVIFTAIILTVADTIYLNVLGINQMERERCVVYNAMPRWLFLIYEYFVEYLIVVMIGVFGAVLVEQYLTKARRFFPKNQLLAFTYGAILPICSCGAIPLIDIMKNRVSLRVIITFLIAAPLLNPYIVMVSVSMLGVKYAVLRIVASFILAMGSAWIVDFYVRLKKLPICDTISNCDSGKCVVVEKDLFVKTLTIVKKLVPYILVGGMISFGLEWLNPKQFLENYHFTNSFVASVIMLIVGIPVYVCNGADVILLKPLIMYTDLTMGPAMIFSLTSSVVCVSSIVMLYKYLGSKITFALVVTIAILSLLIGLGIDLLPSML